MKDQHDAFLRGERQTFTIQYSPDLRSMSVEIPLERTVNGYILSGKIPDTRLSTLRAAILYHRPAFEVYAGPATSRDSHDQEYSYQNTYTRYVRPALNAQHIVQVVWQLAIQYAKESNERDLPIDQILMRKAEWARDIHVTTGEHLPAAVLTMRRLGVPSCWCEMVRFGEPSDDS